MGPALLKLLQRTKGLGMSKDEIAALLREATGKAGGMAGDMASKAGGAIRGAADKGQQASGAMARMMGSPGVRRGLELGGAGAAGMGAGYGIGELASPELDEEELLALLRRG